MSFPPKTRSPMQQKIHFKLKISCNCHKYHVRWYLCIVNECRISLFHFIPVRKNKTTRGWCIQPSITTSLCICVFVIGIFLYLWIVCKCGISLFHFTFHFMNIIETMKSYIFRRNTNTQIHKYTCIILGCISICVLVFCLKM